MKDTLPCGTIDSGWQQAIHLCQIERLMSNKMHFQQIACFHPSVLPFPTVRRYPQWSYSSDCPGYPKPPHPINQCPFTQAYPYPHKRKTK